MVAVFGKCQKNMMTQFIDTDVAYLNDEAHLELNAKKTTWTKDKFPVYRKMAKNFGTVFLQVYFERYFFCPGAVPVMQFSFIC